MDSIKKEKKNLNFWIKKIHLHPLFILFAIYFVVNNQFIFFMNYFFVICLHEFAHFCIAEKKGYKLNKFSLMPYGARLDLNENIQKFQDEVKIILVGPLLNLLLCVLCILFWWIFPITYGLTFYFFEANFYMFLFNLLPIYPLDGGRLLKALLVNKVSFKSTKRIVKIINITFLMLFLVLFITSIFVNINFNLLVVSIFILFTLLDENNNYCYKRIQSIYIRNIITNKLLGVKIFIVNSSITLFHLVKNLHSHYYSEFKIVFNDQSVKTLNQTQILKYCTKLNLYVPIEQLKNKL